MIWISDEWKDYEVLDTSNGERLERWGKYTLVRPDPQVIWNTPHVAPEWKKYDARYVRSNTGGGHWTDHKLPDRWQIRYKDYLTFNVKPMNFKHTGVFPEQAANWDFIRETVAGAAAKRPVRFPLPMRPCSWPRPHARPRRRPRRLPVWRRHCKQTGSIPAQGGLRWRISPG